MTHCFVACNASGICVS